MKDVDLDNMVIFDLETTGLEADCRIVQIAMIRGEKIYQSLVNPEMPIPPESTAIHRITDADVEGKPTFREIADDVLAFIGNAMMAGFNIRKFDMPILRREIVAAGRVFPPLPILDLFELNQKMNPRSLAWFYQNYTGEPMKSEEAHDAVYDCIATLKGFMGMFKKHPELPTDLKELATFAEPTQVPVAGSGWIVWCANQCEPCFNRGKYRGWAMTDVWRKEPSYFNWLNSIDADAITKNLINLFKNNKEAYVSFLRDEHPLRPEPVYLHYRLAMDKNDKQAFEELIELAKTATDPSLIFLGAAWAVTNKHKIARELGQKYLALEDPNLNIDKRTGFLRKSLSL